MVRYTLKTNAVGQVYLPKEVREELGKQLSMVCNARAAIIFSSGTNLLTILESLEIIAKDLRHRLDIENEQKTTNHVEPAPPVQAQETEAKP